MARSIENWYGNAAGRRGGGLGHDPENDDPVDRTPDVWLDNLYAPRTREDRRAPRAATPVRQQTSPKVKRSGGTVKRAANRNKSAHPPLRRSTDPGFAAEVRAVMAQFPGIGAKKLAARLRQQGWEMASPGEVVAAIRQGPAPKASTQAAIAVGRPPRATAHSQPDRAAQAIATRRRDLLIAEVGAFWSAHPRARTDQIAEQLRKWGWLWITLDEVRQVQMLLSKLPRSAREAARDKARVTAPAASVAPRDPTPFRTLDLPSRPGACPACGQVISRLGYCGCYND